MDGYKLKDNLLTGRVDVLERLYRLRDNLDGLSEDDGAFVTEMLNLHENAELPMRHEVLRIVQMRIPGAEIPQDSRVWTQGTVSVVFASPDEVIWQYVPLEKLFALLSRKALHFSPLSVMGDTSEGGLPRRAFDVTKKQVPQNILEGRSGIDKATVTARMLAQRRTDACINCWYMNASDSLEMWKDYAPRNGIAIQSTVRRLGSCFEGCSVPVTIGPVKYFGVDEEEKYTDEAVNGSLYIKHDPFRHERELRALTFQGNMGCGVDVPVVLEVLTRPSQFARISSRNRR